MSNLDLLIVGSSPLVLMRARKLLAAGRRAVILDRGLHPGGSWVTPPLLGFEAVEAGVHLLENRSALYSALAIAGVALAPDRHGFGLVGGHRISLGQSRVLLHGLVAAKSALKGSSDRAARIGLSALRAVTSAGTPFLYPQEGARAITGALLDALPEARLLLGCEVQRIALHPTGPAHIITGHGEFTADQVLIGSRAHAPVFLDGARMPLELEHSDVHSLLLRLEVHEHAPFGYVEIFRDNVVKRVRDVSAFVRPQLPLGQRVICIQLRERREGEEVRERLVRLCLLTETARLLDWAAHDIQLATITDRCLTRLENRCGPRLQVVRTTDFADGYVSAARKRR